MTSTNHEHLAAALHDCTRREPHPDSEEAVQFECQRVAQELRPFDHRGLSIAVSNATIEHQDALLRSRQTSTASHEPLQHRNSLESYATTQSDESHSVGSSLREKHWYSPIVEFWTAHVRYGSVACV